MPQAPTTVKREDVTPPDVGQIATFGSSQPEPTRLGSGFKFLSNTNTEIDEQNVDNVAPPTTDQGIVVFKLYHRNLHTDTSFLGTIPNLKWSMSLSHTRLLKASA